MIEAKDQIGSRYAMYLLMFFFDQGVNYGDMS
jgi:hypothetical protein